MIFLSQLARVTPKAVQRRTVYFTKIKAYIDKDEHGEFKYVTAIARSQGKSNKYHVHFRIYTHVPGSGKVKPNHPTWVHCSCPYFRYYVEVALSARGSSAVLSSNGQFPKIRNPRMKPYLCKHLFQAIPVALQAKAVKRKAHNMPDDLELDQLLRLFKPFIPKK
jgi:hypothetical protein